LYLKILDTIIDDKKNILEYSKIIDNKELKSFYSDFNYTKKDYPKEKNTIKPI